MYTVPVPFMPGFSPTAAAVMLSPWIAVPMGVVTAAIVIAHMRATYESEQPESRKRIRIANGIVMLIVIALLAAGMSLIDHQTHPSPWILTWVGTMLLLWLIIVLGIADMLNTARIGRERKRQFRAAMQAFVASGQHYRQSGEDGAQGEQTRPDST